MENNKKSKQAANKEYVCKDCKWWKRLKEDYGYCEVSNQVKDSKYLKAGSDKYVGSECKICEFFGKNNERNRLSI